MTRMEHCTMSAAALLAALMLVAAPAIGHGATLNFEADITRTLAGEETRFGGCMAALSVKPLNEGLDCTIGSWVTFDCVGEYVTRSAAMRMYDAAQMAFLTERRVRVYVDDTRKHDGYCLVTRIDVL